MILATGVPQSYFHLDGRKKQCGDYRYAISGGRLIIWPKEKNMQSPDASSLLAEVLDGDNGNTPFANEAAIETWLGANFFFKRKSASGLHPKTQEFIAALDLLGEELDPVALGALDRLVKDLNGYSNPDYATANLWPKFSFVYPMLGGKPATHALNLIDTALNLVTWVGSPTHSNSGVTFNGVNQYGNTGFDPSFTLAPGNCHLSFYNPVVIATGGVWIDMGIAGDGAKWFLLSIDDGYDDAYAAGDSYTKISFVNTGAKNVYAIGSSSSHTVRKIFHNGVEKGSSAINTAGMTFASKSMYIGAPNWTSGAANLSGRTCAFATCGQGLSDADVQMLDNANNAFQVALGRK